MQYYDKDIKDVLKNLNTNENGLVHEEVRKRLKE